MRRDRWLVAALAVTVGTVVLTTGVCGFLSRWLAVPGPDGAPGLVAAAPIASYASLPPPGDHADAILGRSLFDSAERTGGGPGGPGGVGHVDALLILTAVADDPTYSTALIAVRDQPAPAIFAEGDELSGATLERIERTRVTVRLPDGERETLRLGAREATPHKLQPVPPGEARTDLRGAITRVDETHYRVERGALEQALAQLGDLAKDAQVVPNFSDGKAAGYRLVRVRPHGLVAELGLRTNDVLTGVNDLATDPATLLGALDELVQADEIRLAVERDGVAVVVQYEIR